MLDHQAARRHATVLGDVTNADEFSLFTLGDTHQAGSRRAGHLHRLPLLDVARHHRQQIHFRIVLNRAVHRHQQRIEQLAGRDLLFLRLSQQSVQLFQRHHARDRISRHLQAAQIDHARRSPAARRDRR